MDSTRIHLTITNRIVCLFAHSLRVDVSDVILFQRRYVLIVRQFIDARFILGIDGGASRAQGFGMSRDRVIAALLFAGVLFFMGKG
ncbi:hypothetical protein BK661_05850 [Pseudomonas frederiksbergensis]|uniref:Uncharacterized protein n=1 Tax=Pseudomonas frederiksbergensis TaxID=104087 RepID=A0A423JDY0_9PSED|nr:hypothetical protein BK661_05850 [Pseudomonas frederiksbergensis]